MKFRFLSLNLFFIPSDLLEICSGKAIHIVFVFYSAITSTV